MSGEYSADQCLHFLSPSSKTTCGYWFAQLNVVVNKFAWEKIIVSDDQEETCF